MGSDGADALGYLDQILAQQPKPDQTLFSHCTEKLACLRDGMISQRADSASLEHVNGVISVVMAGHFPLGAVPWEELRLARQWLVDLVGKQG